MTDNRTTELLREGLTEHGIEWRIGLKGVTFVGDWCFVEYGNGKLAATCEPMLTPEQAIAATLGSDREAELQKALNKAAGNWARADADLRKALDFMRIWISEDAHLGESAISYKFERAEGLRRLAAIEGAIDAWNTRAERTCHIEMYPLGWHEEDGEAPICSACRVAIDEDVYYCPNCGARVVSE